MRTSPGPCFRRASVSGQGWSTLLGFVDHTVSATTNSAEDAMAF